MMKKPVRIGIVVIAALFVAIQLVPVKRENPPGETRLSVPADVRAVLERSCFDCHSNETEWPWYAYVAPASWLVASDVNEARHHLNFSDWDAMEASRRDRATHEIQEEVEEGEMPPGTYLALHADARLSDADRETIRRWAEGTSAGGASSSTRGSDGAEKDGEDRH
jgi:hypothetical protein